MADAQHCNSVSAGGSPGPSDTHCHGHGVKGVVGSRDIPAMLSCRPGRGARLSRDRMLPTLPQFSGWCLKVGLRW